MISACYFDRGDFAPSQQDALALEIVARGKKEAALLVVCDGIEGLQEGEYAGGYVTMRIRDWFYRDFLRHVKRRHGRRRIVRGCVGMLYDCNRYLQEYGREKNVRLGTTMTMILLQGGQLGGNGLSGCCAQYLLFHVGDSRAYLIGRDCKKLTRDDSCEAHGLSRCIGSFPWQGVQSRWGHLRRGERILVCSDGFWRKLGDGEMGGSLGYGHKRIFGKRRALTEEQLEKRLHKLGRTGRARGERDNQAAVVAGMG